MNLSATTRRPILVLLAGLLLLPNVVSFGGTDSDRRWTLKTVAAVAGPANVTIAPVRKWPETAASDLAGPSPMDTLFSLAESTPAVPFLSRQYRSPRRFAARPRAPPVL